jgi:hypothetical protein
MEDKFAKASLEIIKKNFILWLGVTVIVLEPEANFDFLVTVIFRN